MKVFLICSSLKRLSSEKHRNHKHWSISEGFDIT